MLLADYQAYVDCQERVERRVSRPGRAGRGCRSSTARGSDASRRIARSASTAATSGTSTPMTAPGDATDDGRRPDGSRRDAAASTGPSAPLGASVRPGGVNFSVFSKDATLIELLLFDDADAAAAVADHPARSRTRTAPTTTGTPSCRASGRAGLRLPGARAVRAGARPAVRPREGAARSVRARRRRSRRLRPRGRDAGPATTPPSR